VSRIYQYEWKPVTLLRHHINPSLARYELKQRRYLVSGLDNGRNPCRFSEQADPREFTPNALSYYIRRAAAGIVIPCLATRRSSPCLHHPFPPRRSRGPCLPLPPPKPQA
jgi:hypothetical protein